MRYCSIHLEESTEKQKSVIIEILRKSLCAVFEWDIVRVKILVRQVHNIKVEISYSLNGF
jgi:hypothetical protein